MNFNRKKFKQKSPLAEGGVPKVRQVKKKFQDGIKFDSPLELYMYNLLKENNIPFELKRKYVLMPGFDYCGDTIVAITLTVDFYLTDHNVILDPKGHMNPATHLKWKLLRQQLLDLGEDPRICFVYTQKAAREFIEQLKNGFTDEIDDKFIAGRIKKLRKHFVLSGDTFYGADGESVCKIIELSRMTNYDLYKLMT